MIVITTIKELIEQAEKGKYIRGRKAKHPGYVPTHSDGYVEPYAGRFGNGFRAHFPSKSKQLSHEVEYFLRNKDEGESL